MDILVVCSGNICRSPYAAEYLRNVLSARRGDGWAIWSAGTLGIVGSPPSPETLRLARERGLDLSTHRSQGVTYERVDEADLVLVMEERHRASLLERYPEDREKFHLLSEFHPAVRDRSRPPDIFDPIGLPLEDYRRCFDLLRDSLDGFVASAVASPD